PFFIILGGPVVTIKRDAQKKFLGRNFREVVTDTGGDVITVALFAGKGSDRACYFGGEWVKIIPHYNNVVQDLPERLHIEYARFFGRIGKGVKADSRSGDFSVHGVSKFLGKAGKAFLVRVVGSPNIFKIDV